MSGNPVLGELHESIFTRAERARLIALRQGPRWEESVREHQAILAALAEHDSPNARMLVARHVKSTGDAVASQLENEAGA
jgi:DNA-binding GntR family transcriptional regulator